MSLREQIQAAVDLQKECVEVPEWGVTVWVRSLTGKERDEFEARLVTDNGKRVAELSGLRSALLLCTVVDEDGKNIFAPGDEAWLDQKNGQVLDRLASVAIRLAGWDTKKAVETAKGNS